MRFALQPTSLIDYPGKLSCVVFVPGCGLRCPFCHNPGLVEPGPEDEKTFISEEDLMYFLQKRRKVLEGVAISGGEASLWPGLGAFMGNLKDMGFSVKLDTNGMRPELLETLHPDYVAMDIKTSPSAYIQRIPMAPADAKERLERSIAWARGIGAFEMRTTLAPGIVGIEDIEDMAELLKREDEWILQRFRPGKTLDPTWSQMKPYAEAVHQEILEKAKEFCPQAKIR